MSKVFRQTPLRIGQNARCRFCEAVAIGHAEKAMLLDMMVFWQVTVVRGGYSVPRMMMPLE